MTGRRVGGDDSDFRFLGIFSLGVALGSAIRLVAFLVPNRIVRTLENRLLSESK